MLSLFANLIYYFPGELALFHILMSWACPGRAGRVPDESWACPRRELGVSQTRAGRVPDEWGEEPAQNINCSYFFFECECECD